MATLRVVVEALHRMEARSAEAGIAVTIVNPSDRPVPFHRQHAERAALTLQVEDEGGRRVLLAPPAPPHEGDLAPAAPLAPGESIALRYAGFLDHRAPPGRYRVRWFSPHEALGGTRDAPLASDWVELRVAPTADNVRETPSVKWFARPWLYVVSLVKVLIAIVLRQLCKAVLEKEVDVYVTETITNASPSSWNNTYAWNARFHVRLDQPLQRIVVTIRVRLFGTGPVAQWVTSVQNAWSNRFKDCATIGCASNGYPIELQVVYVSSGEHYQVGVASPRTSDMLHWGLYDNDQAHEVGHMLGNKEEYFTVDGVDFGAARQPGGNIMNNPDNPPVAAHYRLIQTTVDAWLGVNYSLAGGSTRPLNVPCSSS